MTKKVFFDTDCISSFFKIGQRNIIEELFDARIVIPEKVYEELSHPRVPHLKKQVDEMLANGAATKESIDVGSNAYYYFKILTSPTNIPMIGKGEGAAMAMAIAEGGILASNNMKDVARFVKQYNIEHYTSLKILMLAEERGILCELECESIWRAMKQHHIRIPEGTYVENKQFMSIPK